jgi:hypothetical protein
VKAHLGKVPFLRLRYLDSWQGQSIRVAEATGKCETLGLEVLGTEGQRTTMMWVGGRKNRRVTF